ncbi:MAG: ferritin-like domain-containing protein [Acidimicrobiales bacterium]
MSIRRLVEQVDEQHREAMRTIADDLGELHFGARSAAVDESRRRFVRRLGLGGVATLGAAAVSAAVLAPAANAAEAQEAGSTAGAGEELPEVDLTIAGFAIGLELAARAAYELAVQTRLLSPAEAELCRTFAGHHGDHADALAVLAGEKDASTSSPNPRVVASVQPQLAGASDSKALLRVLYSIEERAAATYLRALGQLESPTAAGAAASIMPIEGQHAVALGQLLELPTTDWMPAFQTTTDAFDYAG